MTIDLILTVLALVLAGIAQFQARGRDLEAWAIIALALVLLI